MHTAASCFTPFGCHKYTFWCKLTRIPRLHNTVLVIFYPIQIRIVSGLHYCGVNVHHVGVTFTLNWCSHSCKNLHFFGVTITLTLFLCTKANWHNIRLLESWEINICKNPLNRDDGIHLPHEYLNLAKEISSFHWK